MHEFIADATEQDLHNIKSVNTLTWRKGAVHETPQITEELRTVEDFLDERMSNFDF